MQLAIMYKNGYFIYINGLSELIYNSDESSLFITSNSKTVTIPIDDIEEVIYDCDENESDSLIIEIVERIENIIEGK